jgi:hypothetical protein
VNYEILPQSLPAPGEIVEGTLSDGRQITITGQRPDEWVFITPVNGGTFVRTDTGSYSVVSRMGGMVTTGEEDDWPKLLRRRV